MQTEHELQLHKELEINENTVQLCVCEFITAGDYSINSAIDAKSGAFLLKRRVVSAEIVDSISICD